jgi:hypothetical protein
MLHVIPAGMLNYYNNRLDPDDAIITAKIEFLEEKRNLEGFQHHVLLTEENVRAKGDVVFNALDMQVECVFSGIAFDLCNLRPEICLVMIFHDKIELHPNLEVRRRASVNGLSAGDLDASFSRVMPPGRGVPSGAAAFYFGLREALRRGYAIRCEGD